jgi:hypothetical protein
MTGRASNAAIGRGTSGIFGKWQRLGRYRINRLSRITNGKRFSRTLVSSCGSIFMSWALTLTFRPRLRAAGLKSILVQSASKETTINNVTKFTLVINY